MVKKMDLILIQGFSLLLVSLFWTMLIFRILKMRAKNIQVLALHPKKRLKSVLGLGSFLGILGFWSTTFLVLAFVPVENLLFHAWWDNRQLEAITWIGVGLAVASQVIIWDAIITMGKSWRIGIDETKPGDLVTQGIFKFSRNPIFLGLDMVMVAAFLVQPDLFFGIFAIATVILIHFQIRAEEKHLDGIYGSKYHEYMNRTPRYFWKL